jgi:hypothetical protein
MTRQRFEPGTFQIQIYSFTAKTIFMLLELSYLICLLIVLNIICALDHL